MGLLSCAFASGGLPNGFVALQLTIQIEHKGSWHLVAGIQSMKPSSHHGATLIRPPDATDDFDGSYMASAMTDGNMNSPCVTALNA